MRQTKLILIEGVPGSGKSSTGQYLAHQLAGQRIAAKWWYEEEAGNPLVIFDDPSSLQQVRHELAAGRYQGVVEAVLGRWRRFAETQQQASTVVLLDSCFFGYLTWSLFPAGVPEAEIRVYLAEVAGIIAPLEPCLIYLRQRDVGASLRRLLDRRGPTIEARYIAFVRDSAYGRSRALHGFAGLAAFWTAYRDFTDDAFTSLDLTKILVNTDAGDWPSYQDQILHFLDLPAAPDEPAPRDLARFAGRYHDVDPTGGGSCTVTLEGESLYLDGVPQVWPHTRLLPISETTFAVESLPFEATFAVDRSGAATTMTITGPETAFARVDRVLRQEEPPVPPTGGSLQQ